MSEVTTATILLRSGGIITLTNPFIFGNSVAGDIDGRTIRIADDDIESVR